MLSSVRKSQLFAAFSERDNVQNSSYYTNIMNQENINSKTSNVRFVKCNTISQGIMPNVGCFHTILAEILSVEQFYK